MEYTDWTTTGALGDRYVLRAQVGSGRTTTVYAADDVRLEREVAVKLFQGIPSGDAMARFAAEAQVLGGLSHANLVTVYDVGLTADPPYMVMRLIEGGPLNERIGADGLEPAVVARLGSQLSDALAYVHERGVVHGDIDTSNVLVDERGAGHLTGFGAEGLAKPSSDIYDLGSMLAACLPDDDAGPEWHVVLSAMTDPDPEMRPDAIRCGELFRNISAGQTADIPLLPFTEPEPNADEPPAGRDRPPPKGKRTAYAGLAGLGLSVIALAAVLSAVVNSPTGAPTGEQPQQPPQGEPPAQEAPGPQVPGQTYPAPAQRQPGKETEPPLRTRNREQTVNNPPAQTTTPPYDEEYPGDDGPGNGNGNGNGGNGNGNGGLLGGILGGLL